jgi:transcriptional regulator with GAF, ATPase, and Fis domain
MDSTDRPADIDEDQLHGSDLTADFSDMARILFSAGNVTDTLNRVVELATATIEGCDYAGLFLVEHDVVTTPIHTDPTVDDLHGLQHRTGEGPCLDAIAHGIFFYADDIGTDPRWPQFGPEVSEIGIRSALALPLAADSTLGALNLYARYPAAFGVVDRAKAVILASLASLAISVARSHEDEERRAENLQAALGTREVIGQAQGILMERERISAAQAFDVLRRASQHLNRKLRDVAQDLVDTGDRPETGLHKPS